MIHVKENKDEVQLFYANQGSTLSQISPNILAG